MAADVNPEEDGQELSFATELRKAMQAMHMGAQRVSQATAMCEQERVPRHTIQGWQRGHRPQRWEPLLQVANALACDRATTDLWLKLTGYPSLDQLSQRHSLTTKQREFIGLFAPLPEEPALSELTELIDEPIAQLASHDILTIQNDLSCVPVLSSNRATVLLPPTLEGMRPEKPRTWQSVVLLSVVVMVSLYGIVQKSAPPMNYSMDLTVYANQQWQSSPIMVQSGQEITVQYVRGSWRTAPDVPLVVPVGYRGGKAEWLTLPTAEQGMLIMRIGTNTPIPVGTSITLISPASGTLFFQVNDGNCACYDDNEGSVLIHVTVE